MAKLMLVLRRRNLVLLALVVLAAIAGAAHGHPIYGMWDGPLN